MKSTAVLALKRGIAHGTRIAIAGNQVVIGDLQYDLSTKSSYTSQRGLPYSLAAIVQLYCTKDQDHGEYLKACRNLDIDAVSFMDRERIIADLLIPPTNERTRVALPTRVESFDVQGLVAKYNGLKTFGQTGLAYIVVPSVPETTLETIKAILADAPNVQLKPGHEIEHTGQRYRLVSSPRDLADINQVAALFIDGSSGQFRNWPKDITEALRSKPVFYLHKEDSEQPVPDLPKSVTILKTSDKSKISQNLISAAFWTILGHSG
ncbi:hypothetical protein NEHOM01_0951 [Nematocida homosporus]|uniref:uncharacterized protein n=1 Tax=Nematocida homosporus TaxID=1912981 RepID=UPI00222055CA|nr:uncharacterized protein NEHOM01_0951 [Nematocida homosporus]KAI5185625.1 hypothetical protein NEHOM01_0951 [Nematocida homosporus]